mmetsp:Transcript_43793/g.48747  ORF Transcript_43793/g.48747 Transcript_43793/m.48747 type:complete len:366 (-) Transcript_43793:29-1126(-)
MKTISTATTALFLASSSVSAFVAPSTDRLSRSTQLSEKFQSTPTRKSQAIPFVNAPPMLDGTMAGDAGFDPLGFASTKLDLTTMREAEIKHARLAMLAAAGWPLSELFSKGIANQFGMASALDEATGRVPSVLNGGMGRISPIYWIGCIAVAAGVDLFVINSSSKQKGYFPGKLDFDPLGLYPKDEKGQQWMQTAEIKNGRLAMLAITGYAIQEFVMQSSIIDQTPIFFYPVWETVFGDIGTSAITHAVPEAATSVLNAADTVMSDPTPASSALDAAVNVTPSLDAAAAVSDAAAAEAAAAAAQSAAAEAAAASAAPLAAEVAAPLAAAPPVPVVPVDNSELIEAKRRILELESKLAAIQGLTTR